jgi:peroxiredoxin
VTHSTRTGEVDSSERRYSRGVDERLSPLRPGTAAPAFTLQRSAHASVSLTDVRGRRGILVFYPADWEPVSLEQLVLYQHYLAHFARLGGSLLAVSTDHVWCHGAFARAAGIDYPLLADAHPQGAVSRAYGVYDEKAGACSRSLFVLDEHTVIRWSENYPARVNPGVDGILTALEAMGPDMSLRGTHAAMEE